MSTKLIVSCIGGTGALGGLVAGSYYLLNKEPNKSQETNNTSNQETREESTVTKNTKPLKELMGEGFVALSTKDGEDKANWKKLITKYNAVDAPENKIQVEGNIEKGAKDDDAANIKKLQVACTKLLDKVEGIIDKDKETARDWCNKESKLIKEQ